jgi:hypothetical protein
MELGLSAHIAEKQGTLKAAAKKSDGKDPLGRLEYNIKINLKNILGEYGLDVSGSL